MNETPSQERGWKYFFFASMLAGAVLRLLLYLGTHWTIGDSLIGFRFGEQFGAGHGLVFNTGERVSANTTLLYTLLLGLASGAGMKLEIFSRLLGIGCDAVTLWFMKQLVEAAGVRAPALRYGLPVAIYFFPLLAMYAVSGMETSLYVCLIFFLAMRTLKAQDWLYYLAAALVLLCRPDGVISIAASAGYITIRDRKIHWPLALGLAAVGLAYAGLNYAYYGTVVPFTLQAKAFFYHNTRYDNFHFVAVRFFRSDAALALYLLVLLGVLAWLRTNKVMLLLGVMSGALLCFIFLIAPGLRTYYVVPSLYVSATAIAAGLGHFIERRLPKYIIPVSLCGAVGCAAVFAGAGRIIFHQLAKAQLLQTAIIEEPGLWLRDNTPPEASVFVTALEVGYYAKRRMLDSPGMATPKVLYALRKNPDLTLFEQADVAHADYALIPGDPKKAPPNFQLLHLYGSEAANSEYENVSYALYKRRDVRSAMTGPSP